MSHEYRDRIYIRKDILKLMEYGELNQTTLLSYTGLNLAKHRDILEDMEEKGLIKRTEESWGIKFSHSFVSEISYKLKKPGCCKHI